MLRKGITVTTHEGYSVEELGLTLFYLDVFGFRSMEDFKRVYPEEFGVLMGRAPSPSLFTLTSALRAHAVALPDYRPALAVLIEFMDAEGLFSQRSKICRARVHQGLTPIANRAKFATTGPDRKPASS
jgi:hypothetical protein